MSLAFQEFVLLDCKAACHHTSGICLHRNIAQMCIVIFIQNISENDNNSYQGYDNSLTRFSRINLKIAAFDTHLKTGILGSKGK